jgi:hypothetical protein
MGLIKTALKTAVAVKTANVVHDRIQRKKLAEWVAAGHSPESFPQQHLGDATAGVVGAASGWFSPGTPPEPTQVPEVAPAADPVIAQLRELATLKEQGILTDDEFAVQKQRILGA